MTTKFNIGGLYQLNPKYGHDNGKICYLASELDNPNNYVEGAVGFIDPWSYATVKIYVSDPILLLAKDIRYIHVKPFTSSNFIKILVRDDILAFPYTLYQKDVLVDYKP